MIRTHEDREAYELAADFEHDRRKEDRLIGEDFFKTASDKIAMEEEANRMAKK